MRWRSSYLSIPQEKTVGAERILRCFAWLPVRVGVDMVWLASYDQLERVMSVTTLIQDVTPYSGPVFGELPEWVPVSRRSPSGSGEFLPIETKP